MVNFACKDEIISFVMNSSDTDNLIIATFIAGMQAKKSTTTNDEKNNDRQPCKLPENHSS